MSRAVHHCDVSPVVAATESRARKAMTRNCDRTPRDLVLRASGATSTTAVTQFAVLSDQTASTANVAASQWTSTVTGQARLTAIPGEVKRINVGRMLRSYDRRLFTSISELVATQLQHPPPQRHRRWRRHDRHHRAVRRRPARHPHQTVRERGDVSRSHASTSPPSTCPGSPRRASIPPLAP
jgi:hypothetical protein